MKNDAIKKPRKNNIIKLVMLGLALCLIMYLLSDMMQANPVPKTSSKKIEKNPVVAPVVITATAPLPVSVPAPVLPVLSPSTTIPEKMINDPRQIAYLNALDELKQLQLTEHIETVKQSIAKAKLDQRQTQKELMALDAKPLPFVTERTVSDDKTDSISKQKASAPVDKYYVLLYVANENGSWQAVLGLSDKFYNVSIGTQLPDGTTVLDITNTSITLANKESKQTLTVAPVAS